MDNLELKRLLKKKNIALRWSDEDEAWIAEFSCLPYFTASAHGDTPEDAVREIHDAIRGCLGILHEKE